MNAKQRELAELFRKLGARDPDGWARSQLEENINQLGRFLFLRQAWGRVVAPGDVSWISDSRKITSGPGGEIGPALERLLALGADENDLSTVVRVMQWRLLFAFCLLLDDPGDVEEEVKDVLWGLFELDENYQPISPIGALYESVLETDPSGREMRPMGETL